MNGRSQKRHHLRLLSCLLLGAALILMDEAGAAAQAAPSITSRQKAKKCLFPKSKKRAPAWLCGARVEGYAMAAVGSAARSGAGISFMEQMAAADARVRLVQDLRAAVQARVGEGGPQAGGDVELLTRITNESLEGTRIARTAYAPDGTLYVLVGLDDAHAGRLLDSIQATYLARKRH